MKLQPNTLAPLFKVKDVFNQEINLVNYKGTYTLLSFFRNAACPFSNQRLHEMMVNEKIFDIYDLNVIGVFQSSPKHVHELILKHHIPFPLIADESGELYKQYGIESSMEGLIFGILKRPGNFIDGIKEHGFSLDKNEGDYKVLPADFLIDPDLNIVKLHYGEDIGDFYPIEEFMNGLQIKENAKTQS